MQAERSEPRKRTVTMKTEDGTVAVELRLRSDGLVSVSITDEAHILGRLTWNGVELMRDGGR